MLPRIAPLALLLLAACSRAPEMAQCRLVGTWEREQRLPDAVMDQLRADGHDPAPLLGRYLQVFAPDGHAQSESFDANGSWTTRSWIGDDWWEERYEWRRISETSEGLSIEIDISKEPGDEFTRSFAFESPDVIRETQGKLAGCRFIRVK